MALSVQTWPPTGKELTWRENYLAKFLYEKREQQCLRVWPGRWVRPIRMQLIGRFELCINNRWKLRHDSGLLVYACHNTLVFVDVTTQRVFQTLTKHYAAVTRVNQCRLLKILFVIYVGPLAAVEKFLECRPDFAMCFSRLVRAHFSLECTERTDSVQIF